MSNAQADTNQGQSAGNKAPSILAAHIKDCHCNDSLRRVVGEGKTLDDLSPCARNIMRVRGLSLDS